MADSKPSISMSMNEIGSLADRLSARADSILSEASSQHADLRTAARVIRALSKAWNTTDKVVLD